VLAILAFPLPARILGSAQSLAQNADITNSGSNTVSVINTATNTVIATIPVGSFSAWRGGSRNGSKVSIADSNSSTVRRKR
jgi:DNA-binding beta-propeller fold protein YncE